LRAFIRFLEAKSYQETAMLKAHSRYRKMDENRCAICAGKFGLIRYYSWNTGLCSKRCRDRYRARQEGHLRWLWRAEAV
jgi:hypothetical protein